MRYKENKKWYRIGKCLISITNQNDAISNIEDAALNNLNGYVCVSNMRMVRYANKTENADYLKVMANSLMNLPDGMPLVWCARLWGLKKVGRTSGPELFQKMIKDSGNDIKHFLLGDTEDTLNAIKTKYTKEHSSNIVGTYSPPFANVDEFDYKGIAETINKSEADIVWVAMRSPKQDIFSNNILPLLNNKICISVGRAFRIAIGEVKDAPKSIQKLGVSGFYSRRVSFRETFMFYFTSTFSLLKYVIQILYWRLTNVKHFE